MSQLGSTESSGTKISLYVAHVSCNEENLFVFGADYPFIPQSISADHHEGQISKSPNLAKSSVNYWQATLVDFPFSSRLLPLSDPFYNRKTFVASAFYSIVMWTSGLFVHHIFTLDHSSTVPSSSQRWYLNEECAA